MKKCMSDVRLFLTTAGDQLPTEVVQNISGLPHQLIRRLLGLVLEEAMELADEHIAELDLLPFTEDDTPQQVVEKISKEGPLKQHIDVEKVADALTDINFVVLNMALHYGIPMERVWDEVQAANMRKFSDGVLRRPDDGKILKPEGWVGPDINRALFGEDTRPYMEYTGTPEQPVQVDLTPILEELEAWKKRALASEDARAVSMLAQQDAFAKLEELKKELAQTRGAYEIQRRALQNSLKEGQDRVDAAVADKSKLFDELGVQTRRADNLQTQLYNRDKEAKQRTEETASIVKAAEARAVRMETHVRDLEEELVQTRAVKEDAQKNWHRLQERMQQLKSANFSLTYGIGPNAQQQMQQVRELKMRINRLITGHEQDGDRVVFGDVPVIDIDPDPEKLEKVRRGQYQTSELYAKQQKRAQEMSEAMKNKYPELVPIDEVPMHYRDGKGKWHCERSGDHRTGPGKPWKLIEAPHGMYITDGLPRPHEIRDRPHCMASWDLGVVSAQLGVGSMDFYAAVLRPENRNWFQLGYQWEKDQAEPNLAPWQTKRRKPPQEVLATVKRRIEELREKEGSTECLKDDTHIPEDARCCERDHGGDGNCDRHPPGFMSDRRTPFKEPKPPRQKPSERIAEMAEAEGYTYPGVRDIINYLDEVLG
jgi:predicted HAD superfamily Cof-like phosphohydrolase